jgi:hypothetical protein
MRRARLLLLFLVATAVWLPTLHVFFALGRAEREALAARLAARQVDADRAATAQMRAVNPEWDFMRRTFTVLALSNRALARPAERARDLAAIDAIVDETLATLDAGVEELGDAYFLLPYARRAPFLDPEGRSLFIDGEIVAMIAARDMVEPRPATAAAARLRAGRIERAMRRSPSLSAESYPDECWTFCNTTALAGLAMLDRSRGEASYAALASDWVAHARANLVDPDTGLLVSSYTRDGRVVDGPEGSSIWMTSANLLLIDEAFAREQYAIARRELGRSWLGFGWAVEWPRGAAPRPDVDSGPIVPLLDASPGSSGLALLGASAFGDEAWLGDLLASLELAGFRDASTDRYRAGNDVGDAVLLYALAFGPLAARMRVRPGATALTSNDLPPGNGGAR